MIQTPNHTNTITKRTIRMMPMLIMLKRLIIMMIMMRITIIQMKMIIIMTLLIKKNWQG